MKPAWNALFFNVAARCRAGRVASFVQVRFRMLSPVPDLTDRQRQVAMDFVVLLGFFGIDAIILFESFVAAHLLRFDFNVPADQVGAALPRFLYAVLIQL